MAAVLVVEVLVLAVALKLAEVLLLALALVSATGPLWAKPLPALASVANLHICFAEHYLTQTYQLTSLLLSTTLLPSKEFIPSVDSLQKRRSFLSKTLNLDWKPSLATSSSQILAQSIAVIIPLLLTFLFSASLSVVVLVSSEQLF